MSNYNYYSNDPNELLRRKRDYEIHKQKLAEIKRARTPNIGERIQISKSKQLYFEELKMRDIFHKNSQIASRIAQIHTRQLHSTPPKTTVTRDKRQSQMKFQLLDENMKMCKRILEQHSNISFKQYLNEFKQHQQMKKRLQRVSHQFDQISKISQLEPISRNIRSKSTHHF